MKILEIADLHINPKWIESQKPVLHTIVEQGKIHKPDIICIAGDIYDRDLYNSEKDNITFVRRFMRDLLNIAPVVMITGTPSHDAPGSYGIFEEMGCHVLSPEKPKIIKGCLFIGLPEIDKSNFMAKHKLSMKEANQEIQKKLNEYILTYWVPIREENKDIPCVFMGHGVFVDNPNEENPIIKNTDFVIDNNLLKQIKADRYIFGHIHEPIQSKVLNGGYAGYAGFDRSPWNNTGFQPGFNLTEIDLNKYGFENKHYGFHTDTTRIPYPVVRKKKIKMNFSTLKKMKPKNFQGCDVRIDLKIKKSDLVKTDIKQFQEDYKIIFDCNSCEIVPDIIKEESQRITREQAEKLTTLWDKYCFFKGWEDCSVTGFQYGFRDKILEIEKNVLSSVQQVGRKTVKLLSLEVSGSIFSIDAWGRNCFYHDFSNDPTGLTLIGNNNGQGKSTYFGFASPYPVFLGWDYRSLKEFFPGDGCIKKRFNIDGVIHEHVIFIGKKIECFWNVEDEPQIINSQLKPFMAECEKVFGPITSFVSTSYFAQEPWRMKNYVSSITSSSATELRNAYLEIVGISREQEREYAHEKKKTLEAKIHDLEIKKETKLEIIEDKKEIEKKHDELKNELNDFDKVMGILVHSENEKQKEFDEISKKYEEQKKIKDDLERLKKEFNSKLDEEANIINTINKFDKINVDELKKQIDDNDQIKKSVDLLRDDWKKLSKIKDDIREKVESKEKEKRDSEEREYTLNSKISELETKTEVKEDENKILSKPCFFCGKIDPESEETIKFNKGIIKDFESKTPLLLEELQFIKELKKQETNEIEQLKAKLPDNELKHLEEKAGELKAKLLDDFKITAIQNQIIEYSKLSVYQGNLEKIKKEMADIKTKIKELKIKRNPFIEEDYNSIENALSDLKTQIVEIQNELSKKEGLIKGMKEQLEKIKNCEKEIGIITGNLAELNVNLHEWKTIYDDMQSNKLPALELQIIAEDIDYKVNQQLAGKYIINTITQDVNKNGDIIDRFDILVYNPQSGIEKSLLAHSPGQRAAYFIEPLSQALREKRQKREGVEFMWSVADETDNPIMYEHIRDYYEIMGKGLSPGHTRFIMSQKSEIKQFIKNTINMEDVVKDV